jgi:glutamine cyclotransferase
MDSMLSLRFALASPLWRRATLLSIVLLAPAAGCRSQQTTPLSAPTPAASMPAVVQARPVAFRVVQSFPHDSGAFTQGLLWHDGALYESTGLEGKSSVRRVDLATGKVLQIRRQPDDVFSEGLALAGDRLYQITWQNRRAFAYDLKTFQTVGEWTYEGEGWGLTCDGHDLIMSDGSEYLTRRDPQTFEEKKRVAVTFNGKALRNLNELEWINGQVWANVWQSDTIVRIDPQSGAVQSYLDCSDLLGKQTRRGGEDVLNGIAYDAQNKRIFITGKLWPRLFEIKVSD